MLLYRPNFCCNCGEKIERMNWTILSSRKFCDLCQTELRGHDWAPKITAAVFSVVGLAAISNLFWHSPEPSKLNTESSLVGSRSVKLNPPPAKLNTTPAELEQSQTPTNGAAAPATLASQADNKARPASKIATGVFYCGAATKKGTACSRRVKRPGERCWQHSGMPSILDVEESTRK